MKFDIPELLIGILSVMLLVLWINDRIPRHHGSRHHRTKHR